MTMTDIMPQPPGAAYADSTSIILDLSGDVAAFTAIWAMRDDSKADANARRAASDAMDAIDRMTRELYRLRERLVSDIRAADDASAARVDAMLAARREPQR